MGLNGLLALAKSQRAVAEGFIGSLPEKGKPGPCAR